MVLGDISLGDLIWSMLWFFFLFMWIMILFNIIGDLFRDHETSGGMKALWIIFLVLAPFLAALIYLIARGKGMQERALAQAKRNEQDFAQYVQTMGAAGDPAEQIAKAKALLDAGTIDQAEFDALKAKALA